MSSTLTKSLKVLERIADSESPRGISELARELDLDKSAVQRILKSLVDAGYCEKVGQTGSYRATLRLWELGSRVIAKNEIRRLLHPVLRYGATISGLTVYFAILDYPDIVYLDRVEGSRGRPNASDPGRRVPIHATALGRAILAFLGDERLQEARAAATRRDESAALARASGEDFDEAMAAIRERMYALSESGSQSGVTSIAAPVWRTGPSPVGSIGLTTDTATLQADQIPHIAQTAVSLAYEGTRVLGGRFPRASAETP
ncbi:MAG: IclR family transcriptional regulator [Lautropia sp.]